jgi:Replication initiation factor
MLHDLDKMCARAAGEVYASWQGPARKKVLGYDGVAYGEKLFFGEGSNGVLLQASGLAAQVVAEYNVISDGVPRLDVQATCWFAPDTRCAFAVLADTRAALSTWKYKPWKVTHYRTDGGGETVYIGSRGKDTKFLRIYDKGAESGEEAYAGAWRFEAELTDTYAAQAYAELLYAGTNGDTVSGIVSGYCAQRGVRLPVLSAAPQMPYSRVPRDEAAEERRKRWLSEQVKPSIQKAMAEYGWTREEVRELLGL